MSASYYQSINKIFGVFYYFLNTLCLALTAIGITKYMLDDRSWVNYLIVVVSLFSILLVIKHIKDFGRAANKVLHRKNR